MSGHRARIEWTHAGGEFSYDVYSRNYSWVFPHGAVVAASAAPRSLGDESRIDPEEVFVAFMASCHMLTFLALAAKKCLRVESCEDDACGRVEKNDDGKLAVTEVVLRPRVRFADGAAASPGQLKTLHAHSHSQCFIANSVTSSVRVDAQPAN